MSKPLIVGAEAEVDVGEAYGWYEDQRPGLGAQFVLCVEAVIASIERNPRIYPIIYRGIVRRALTQRFPYAVFFVEGEQSVVVIGVIHAKRNPRVWQDRAR